jgi:predicted NUDIX family NTP pyrophosphohydrolase
MVDARAPETAPVSAAGTAGQPSQRGREFGVRWPGNPADLARRVRPAWREGTLWGARYHAEAVTRSAGLLLYRVTAARAIEVLVAHPGGPFWARRDDGVWSVPKGEYGPGDDALAAAYREFREETGSDAPAGEPIALGEVRQPSGKWVSVWALEGDLDATRATSNTFEMEWPRGSGAMRSFPEIDRLDWVAIPVARTKLLKGQVPFVDRLMDALGQERDGA